MINEKNKEIVSNILILFSMLVGMAYVSVIESRCNPIKAWDAINVNSFIDVVDIAVDITLHGVSIAIAHPLTVIMLIAFMTFIRGKLK